MTLTGYRLYLAGDVSGFENVGYWRKVTLRSTFHKCLLVVLTRCCHSTKLHKITCIYQKGSTMTVEALKTDLIASTSDLQRQGAKIIESARTQGKPIAILNHNKLAGYFVPVESINDDRGTVGLSAEDMDLARTVMARHKDRLVSLSKR